MDEFRRTLQEILEKIREREFDINEMSMLIEGLCYEYPWYRRHLYDHISDHFDKINQDHKDIKNSLSNLMEQSHQGNNGRNKNNNGGNGGGNGNNNFEQVKIIYETMWKKVDTELNQLWQRSVLLMTVFAGLFTAYFGVFEKMSETTTNTMDKMSVGYPSLIGISLLGVIFSILWIFIGKGSQYWYLKYYKVIENIEKSNDKLFPKGLCFTSLPVFNDNEISECIFSTKPGRYSVTSCQIAIGVVFFIVWTILYATHTAIYVSNIASLGRAIMASILPIIIVLCILYKWLRHFEVYSLEKNEEEKIKEKDFCF